MAALSNNRNTRQRNGEKVVLPLADDVLIYLGAIVGIDTTGYAHPGGASTTNVVMGIATQAYPHGVNGGPGFPGDPADNTVVGHSAGAVGVEVERDGIWSLDNDGSITSAKIGQLCFVVDDHTVSLTDGSGTRYVAGRVFFVDTDGSVWVDFKDRSALAT